MRAKNALKSVAGTLLLAIASLVPLLLAPAQVSAAGPLPEYRYTHTPIQTSGFIAAGHVTTDIQGNVYVAGVFNGTVNFAGSLGSDTITSNVYTSYLTKYNADNTYGWTKILDAVTNNGSTQTNGVATDAAGNVYIAGSFSGGVIFDGPGGSDAISSNGNGSSAFLTKYTPSGAYVETKTIIAPFGQTVTTYGLAIDSAGRIVLAGSFTDSVDFNPGAGTDTYTDAGGNGNVFVSVYNADGSYGWTRAFDTTAGGGSGDTGVATDGAGNVYLTGWLYGAVDFNGTGGTDNYADSGNGTSFTTRFNTDGSYGWTRIFDYGAGSSYTFPTGIAVDGTDNVYTTGMFSGTVDFDGTAGTDNQTDAAGSGNGYLAKYTAGGSYVWTKTFDTSPGGNAYTAAVTSDLNGGIYVLSSLSGSVDFDDTSDTDIQNQPNGGALTMYNPDGSYAWTRVFDSTNGTAVTTQGITAAIAADRLGNVFVASQFTGTVLFDGPGGNDSRTAAIQNGFLTSFRTFIPATSSVGATAAQVIPGSAGAVAGQLANTGAPIAATTLLAIIIMASSVFVRTWQRPGRKVR